MGRLSAVGISRTGAAAALIVAAALMLADAIGVGARGAGSIVGVVSTKEPAPKPIRATIDPAVCGQMVPDESIAVDASGHLANVVVTVPGVKGSPAAETPVANDKCRFVPRVSVLRPKGTLKATSKDATLHTMHAAGADGRAFFNVSLPIPNMTISRPIDRPGIAVLTCSTHTWMKGFVHVTDDLAAVSGADGSFRLDNVPAGTYELRIWHEVLKTAAPVKVTVKDGETAKVELSMIR